MIHNNQIRAVLVERIHRRFLKCPLFKTSGKYPTLNVEYQLGAAG